MKILLVTPDIIGPVRNGGIGTAFYALAKALQQADHDVTILYVLGDYCENGHIQDWIAEYQRLNICFVPLSVPHLPQIDAPPSRLRSYQVYAWLKSRASEFDVAYFPEWRADAYYALQSKRLGLHFENLKMIVVTHSPTEWAQGGNYQLPASLDDVEIYAMEKAVVSMADMVISPSHYMLDWLRSHHVQLPQQVRVIQNILPDQRAQSGDHSLVVPPVELVFFGRLEHRKGLKLFCDALDRLSSQQWSAVSGITFMGKTSGDAFDSLAFIKSRSPKWPVSTKVLTHLDHAGAQDYLHAGQRVAVIPSLVENSPYTVLECLGQGIPFLAAAVGGIPELIHADDHAKVLFPTNPSALSQQLSLCLAQGFTRARLAVSLEETLHSWQSLHVQLTSASTTAPSAAVLAEQSQQPLVSVCLVHYNRPHCLAQALDSLRVQTYPNFEVILVDDGSTQLAATNYLQSLQSEFDAKGWTIVRKQNAYLGAARNTAADHASGEYLMFMDDDNIAKPDMIATFVSAALASGADVLTAVSDLFTGEQPPTATQPSTRYWLPLGGHASPGLFRNVFGDANALVRKSLFDQIGGFTEDYGIGHEDWEFFARIVLQGHQLHLVPEPLFWYRVAENSMLRTGDQYKNDFRSARPFLQQHPLGSALGYALYMEQQKVICGIGVKGLIQAPFKLIKLILQQKDGLLIKKFMTKLRQQGLKKAIYQALKYVSAKPR